MHPLFNVDIDAANGIYNTFKRRSIHENIMRYRYAEQCTDRRECQLMPTICVGMIDLIVTVIPHLYACIARDREQRRVSMRFIDGSEYQRITAPCITLPAVDAHQ